MEEVSLLKFRQHLTEYLNQAKYQNQRVMVTRNGQALGAFVPLEDIEKLEALEMQQDVEDFDKAMAKHKKNGKKTISHDEFKKRIGL